MNRVVRRSSGPPARPVSRSSKAMVLAALVLLTQPRWSFAEDPFSALNLIKPNRPVAAKDFSVAGLDSRPLRLSDFKDRVRLVNFWATWCLPCKDEMPAMERLYRRYQGRGFTIIGISIDTNLPAVEPFVKHLGLTFPIGLDPKLVVANDYTVRSLPSSFLIDRGGTIVAIALGPRDWDGAAARGVIEALLR